MQAARNTLARRAPSLMRPAAAFHTTPAPNGMASTIGTLGLVGVLAHPAYPPAEAAVSKVLPKDEYKVMAWIAGVGIFGAMASSGESAPPAADEEQTPEQLAEIEAFFEAFADPAEKNDLEVVSTKKAPGAIGPYSQAIKSGGFLYSSGQIAMEPATGNIPLQMQKDAAQQTAKCLKNLDAVLTAGGVTRKDVTKATVFVTDLKDFAAVNAQYVEYFGKHKPARSCVQVAALPKGALVEIEAVARLKEEPDAGKK